MTAADLRYLRRAWQLARRGYGTTSPNPMVGAVLVRAGRVLGEGYHRRAGEPHAEIEALRDAARRGHQPRGATLYVTLEPCSTHGRTPPCTEAIKAAKIKRVVIGAQDPNPNHAGHGLTLLRQAGLQVAWAGDSPTASAAQKLAQACTQLNEAFNHWIVHRTPWVIVKAAMTLDGKIATASGESKWITGPDARAYGMQLRQGSDAILVGVNTILADDPSLTVRTGKASAPPRLRRIILDSRARTPLNAKVVRDEYAALTTIVVGAQAPARRVAALARHVKVWQAPAQGSAPHSQPPPLNLRWLLKKLGQEAVSQLLVEGGGEVNASFLLGRHAHRIVFFYAPKILGGRTARKGVAGEGAKNLNEALPLTDVKWRKLGDDLLLTART